ncbi:GL20626 [Drosophila persimilis]|uniref:GL20626 n=1 Tax=Drosophila persimilis TaxID=7234 RepID=B4GCB0_DROPE|nr:GL20626 [Drosophila persimilis]
MCLTLLAAFVACQASEEIYQILAKDYYASKNLIISPFAIDTILSLVYMGAAGATATELQNYLKLSSEDKQLVTSKYNEVLDGLFQPRADGPNSEAGKPHYLGIRELFTDDSDLSGLLADKANGKISKFVHKAVLDVNEEGVEASAATYGMITNRSSFTMVLSFDHPFAFVIRDQRTIYFQGHVVSP